MRLRASSVAEVRVLAVIRSATVIVLTTTTSAASAAPASSATTAAASASSPAAATTSAATAGSAETSSAAAKIAARRGANTEAAVNRARAEATEAEAVIRRHAGRQSEGIRARAVAQRADQGWLAAGSTWTAPAPATSVHKLLTTPFVVAGCAESAAGAAVNQKRFFGIRAFDRNGGSRVHGGDGVLAFGRGTHRRVLKASAAGRSVAVRGIRLLSAGAGRSAKATTTAAPAKLAAIRTLRGRGRCGGFRRSDAGGFQPVHQLWHFESPVFLKREQPGGDALGGGREFEHLDPDVPFARRQIEGIAAVFVGESGNFPVALRGGHGRAGNELIGRADGAAVLSGAKRHRTEDRQNGESGQDRAHKVRDQASLYCPGSDFSSRPPRS